VLQNKATWTESLDLLEYGAKNCLRIKDIAGGGIDHTGNLILI
jgi:hypothetical protein